MKAFKTHKFTTSGLRYEVGICILTGDIVWVIGPFPCGDWPDIEIFRFCLKQLLGENERVETDDGYIGENPTKARIPGSLVHDQDEKQLYVRTKVRRRHETINKEFKKFNIISDTFDRNRSMHVYYFMSVVVLTQLAINRGCIQPFQVSEYDDVTANLPSIRPGVQRQQHSP